MIIHYPSNKLENILNDPRLLKKNYAIHHKNIENRLSELKVAKNLGEIPNTPPPRRHKLSESRDYKNCWGIDYSRNFRIIVKPVGEFDINDLSTITEIAILDLEDYH